MSRSITTFYSPTILLSSLHSWPIIETYTMSRPHVIERDNESFSGYRKNEATSWYSIVYHADEVICIEMQRSSQVNSYSVLRDVDNSKEALWFLATLGAVVEPFMLHHRLKIGRFYEIHPSSSLLGIKSSGRFKDVSSAGSSTHSKSGIGLRLRPSTTPKKFLSLEVVLDTLCHELAHIWKGSHELVHLRK
jgi:hypothetical protein